MGAQEFTKGYGDFNCPIGVDPPNCQPNPSGLRFDTAEGGLIYRWHRYAKFHPLAKVLAGFGNEDFPADINVHYPSGEGSTRMTPETSSPPERDWSTGLSPGSISGQMMNINSGPTSLATIM